MKWLWVVPKEGRRNNWIIFRENPAVSLRARYGELACSTCGKVDELLAVSSGIDSDVRIVAKADFLTTSDGFLCVSRRAARVIDQAGIRGVRLVELPDRRYFVALPSYYISVQNKAIEIRDGSSLDFAALARNPEEFAASERRIKIELGSCGMEFHDRCPVCSRFAETVGWPRITSMELPDDPATYLLAPNVGIESWRSRCWWFVASEMSVMTFHSAGVTGVQYLDAP